MKTEFRIAYGFDRVEKQFLDCRIYDDKYFIDNKGTSRIELEDMLTSVKAGVVVVVLQLKDFGNGVRAKQVREAIESRGGSVEIVKVDAKSTGRKTTVNFTKKDLEWACALWNDRERDKAVILKRIADRTGQVLDRHQMNYQCRRKSKRQAGQSS